MALSILSANLPKCDCSNCFSIAMVTSTHLSNQFSLSYYHNFYPASKFRLKSYRRLQFYSIGSMLYPLPMSLLSATDLMCETFILTLKHHQSENVGSGAAEDDIARSQVHPGN